MDIYNRFSGAIGIRGETGLNLHILIGNVISGSTPNVCALMETYHMDSLKPLHWWKFKALFIGLNNECEFYKIKLYRLYDGKDKNLLKLKEYYKLPRTKIELKDKLRQEKLYEALK